MTVVNTNTEEEEVKLNSDTQALLDSLSSNISEMSTEDIVSKFSPDKAIEGAVEEDVPMLDLSEKHKALLASIVPPNSAPETKWNDYLWNSVKLGTTSSVSLAAGAVDALVIEPVKQLINDPAMIFNTDYWDMGDPDHWKNLGKKIISTFNRFQENISAGDPDMPKTGNTLVDWTGTGVMVAADPLNLVTLPAKTAAQVVSSGARMFSVGLGSEVGAWGGGELAQGTDYETEARIGGSIVTGILSPTASTLAIKSTLSPVKEIAKKWRFYRKNPDLVNQQYATGAARRFLELAAKEQGVKNLDGILDEFAKIKYLLGDDAKGIPLFIQMSENPIIKSQVIRLSKENADFKYAIEKEIENVAKHIDGKANIFFGTEYTPLKGTEKFSSQIRTTSNNLIRARQVIDTQINRLSSGLIPNLSDSQVGKRIANLVKKREKIVMDELSPHYTSLKDKARTDRVFMSVEDTSNIYNYVKNNRLRDIFGKGTALDTKIMNYLKPRKNADGFLIKPKLSFDQVDSLKRAINKLKRGRLTADEARKLDQLSDVVGQGRNNMPGKYNAELERLDKVYYQRIGIPFGSDTMKLMGSKKYIEQVVPVILKNESSLHQFFNASGKEGAELARIAYNMKIYDKVVKDGVIHIPSLKALLKKDRSIIDMIPGMKEDIDNIILDTGKLFKLKKNMDNKVKLAENQLANNFLKNYDGNVDYLNMANKLANRDSAFFKKIQKDMKYLDKSSRDAINKNIQRQFLTYIFHNTEGNALAFLTAPQNKKIINEVFGPKYVENIKKLGRLSDSLKKADVGEYSSKVEKASLGWFGGMKARFGVDVPYLSSQYRDRIASKIMKGTRILSKASQHRMQTGTDEKLKEVLLDPNAIKQLGDAAEVFNFSIDNPLKLQKIIGILSESIPAYMYGTAKVEMLHQKEEIDNYKYGMQYRELRTY